MKAGKMTRSIMTTIVCLGLFGCADVHAKIAETECSFNPDTEQEFWVESELDDIDDDIEEVLELDVEKMPEENELILDQTPETESMISDRTPEATENETEAYAAASEEEALPVVYTIADQRLESGKTFDDIVVPECAIAEDGSEVTGEVEWLDPDSGMALDSQMELSGADGESMTWEWMFVPEEEEYENVQGEVELTMYTARHGVENTIMDKVSDVRETHPQDDKKQNTSASGSSIGAANIREAESLTDAEKWMGSAMTGLDILGSQADRLEYATANGSLTITHGVVKRREAGSQTEVTEQMQTEKYTVDTEREEKATFASAENDPNVVQFPERSKKSDSDIDSEMAYKTGWLFLLMPQVLLCK